MNDVKKLVNRRIGGLRYPDKKRINFYPWKFEKYIIFGKAAGCAGALITAAGLACLCIAAPLKQAERAELTYHHMEEQLVRLREKNQAEGKVQKEYAHYGDGCLSESEKCLPERVKMFKVLEERIFPNSIRISSVSVMDDRMEIRCVLESGVETSALVKNIEADEHVRYVSVLQEEMSDMEAHSEEKEENRVTISAAVYFYPSEES